MRPQPPRRPVAVPEVLLARARRGEQAAFDAVYDAYQPYLLRHLRLTSGDLAEDVAASTWESVAKSMKGFRGDGDDFRRFLFTISRRRLIDELRRQSRRPLTVVESVGTEPSEPFCSPLEESEWIDSVLKRLPTRQAEVISLRIVAGMNVEEVAELLGISRENVRVLTHRGLVTLRAEFRESRSEPVTDRRQAL